MPQKGAHSVVGCKVHCCAAAGTKHSRLALYALPKLARWGPERENHHRIRVRFISSYK